MPPGPLVAQCLQGSDSAGQPQQWDQLGTAWAQWECLQVKPSSAPNPNGLWRNFSFRAKMECGQTSQFFPKRILPQPGSLLSRCSLQGYKENHAHCQGQVGDIDTEDSSAQPPLLSGGGPSTTCLCSSLLALAVPPGLLAHPSWSWEPSSALLCTVRAALQSSDNSWAAWRALNLLACFSLSPFLVLYLTLKTFSII